MLQKSYDNSPSLYLIPTPIGNMDDITFRAINTLKCVDCIFCEDTRITAELLKKFEIKNKLIHSDDHNEEKNKLKMLDFLKNGKNVGIVTDRGTPIISDPGYKLVEFASSNGFNVISLPGATAFVPALTMSAISPSPFLFYGFLNSKKVKKEKELELIKNYNFTMIFYEAPHRIIETLNSMNKIFGNRKIAVCREISKKYEEIIRGTIEEVLQQLNEPRGEYVIVVSGNQNSNFEDLNVIEHVNMYIEQGMNKMDAIKLVAKQRNIHKNDLYKKINCNKQS